MRAGQKVFQRGPLDPMETNRFKWKSTFSIRQRLRENNVLVSTQGFKNEVVTY